MKLQPDWRIIWPHLGSLLAATHDEPVRKKDSREPVYYWPTAELDLAIIKVNAAVVQVSKPV